MTNLDHAIRQFENAEAALKSLQTALGQLYDPDIFKGSHTQVQQNQAKYRDLYLWYGSNLSKLPKISNWRPISLPVKYSELLSYYKGFSEDLGEFITRMNQPKQELCQYKRRLDQQRIKVVKKSIELMIFRIDNALSNLNKEFRVAELNHEEIDSDKSLRGLRLNATDDVNWSELKNSIKQVDFLLGSSISRPKKWYGMERHIKYGQAWDLQDIIKHEWPLVKEGIVSALDTSASLVNLIEDDLANLDTSELKGTVAVKLKWDNLSSDDFERLIFNLLCSDEKNHQNPQWLTQENAPDRGRDLSVYKVYYDELSGTTRKRVIIQCKHWRKTSIATKHICDIKAQITLWEPPVVDILVIATSGRFTSDAITLIEKDNQTNRLQVEMWPDSHLESLLAKRPDLISEFNLR